MGFLKFVIRLRFPSCCSRIQEKSDVVCVDKGGGGGGGGAFSEDDGGFKEFTWEEMKRVTKNFSKVIGYGGFSTVYLARLPDNTRGAIKVVHGSTASERLSRIYRQELEIYLRVRHPNVVTLLGYCDDDREDGGVLVFDYVPNGNLQQKLHRNDGDQSTATHLTWKKRVLIAFQLAQVMEYLHEKSGLQIVHGDIKSSNILLDQKFNCKLCDFGSAKMGFASTVLPPSSSRMDRFILGSEGYMDPHYLKTGIVSKKNDIYSFGVIVSELVTGKEALCLSKEKELVMEVKEMVDPRLWNDGGFDLEEAKFMAFISTMCLCSTPILRPSATQILASMRDKISSMKYL